MLRIPVCRCSTVVRAPIVKRAPSLVRTSTRTKGLEEQSWLRTFSSAASNSSKSPSQSQSVNSPYTRTSHVPSPTQTPSASAANSNPTSYIHEASLQNMPKIIHSPVPVVIACYIPGDPQCTELIPRLESAVQSHHGRVVMYRADIQAYPILRQQLNVQRVPHVVFIQDQHIIGSFAGVRDQQTCDQMIRALVGPTLETETPTPTSPDQLPADPALVMERVHAHMNAGEWESAISILQKLLNNEERYDEWEMYKGRATLTMMECQLHLPSTDLSSLQQSYNSFTTSLRTNKALRYEIMGPETHMSWDPSQPLQSSQQQHQQSPHDVTADTRAYHTKIGAQIQLAIMLKDVMTRHHNNVENVHQTFIKDSNDWKARHDVAVLIFHEGQHAAAIDQAVKLISYHRQTSVGRSLLVHFFDVLGKNHPLSLAGRKKMTAALW